MLDRARLARIVQWSRDHVDPMISSDEHYSIILRISSVCNEYQAVSIEQISHVYCNNYKYPLGVKNYIIPLNFYERLLTATIWKWCELLYLKKEYGTGRIYKKWAQHKARESLKRQEYARSLPKGRHGGKWGSFPARYKRKVHESFLNRWAMNFRFRAEKTWILDFKA